MLGSQVQPAAQSSTNQSTTHQPGQQAPKPSRLLLWAVHLCNICILILMTLWPISSQSLSQTVNEYCTSTYFSGYNSPDCSSSLMTACHKDSKCALNHEFFDRDDNFFCSSGRDCEECKCIEANVKPSLIALWVFTGIGFAIELVRWIIACQFSGQKSFSADSGALACISDSIFLRWVQIVNPSFYTNEIMEAYNMRYLFGFCNNALLWVNYILHLLPCYICAFIIYGIDSSNKRFTFYLFGAMTLEIVQLILKVRYRNGEPYKSAQTQINVLPTQGQVMGVVKPAAQVPAQQYGAPLQQQPVQYVQQPHVMSGQGQMVQLPDGRMARVLGPVQMAPQQQGVAVVQPMQMQASAPYVAAPRYASAPASAPPPAYGNVVVNNGNPATGEGANTVNQWG
eukprot:585958_1